jgi:hypothetical protein
VIIACVFGWGCCARAFVCVRSFSIFIIVIRLTKLQYAISTTRQHAFIMLLFGLMRCCCRWLWLHFPLQPHLGGSFFLFIVQYSSTCVCVCINIDT